MPLRPYFLINLLYKLATIRQISYSQTCTFPQSSPEDGNILVGSKYLVVLWFTKGFLARYRGALRTTLVIETSIFVEGDLA
jgi:hypothetical protein